VRWVPFGGFSGVTKYNFDIPSLTFFVDKGIKAFDEFKRGGKGIRKCPKFVDFSPLIFFL